jgi:hypothetical protein
MAVRSLNAILTSPLRLLGLVAALSACTGEEPKPAPPAEGGASEAPAPTPDVPALDLAGLDAEAETVTLVPSPIETQRALERAGIETRLASLIPKHAFDVATADTDQAALRTGVVLADALLTVKTAEKPDLVARLDTLHTGLKQLDAGPKVLKRLEDLKQRVEADAVTRDELLKEFDELSGAALPELKFGGNDRILPLIQAGSWLEGANLVARAVKEKGDPSAADILLKQPRVVEHFLGFVRKNQSSTPPAVTAKLEESLLTLQGLAGKAEPLAAGDIDTVIRITGDVLALL